jgi:GH25 family lysozyme M1 (1,4-beta-N-acetylmuramidase)
MRVGVSLVKRPRPTLLRAAAAAALVAAVTVTSAGVASAGVIGPDVSSNNHSNGATVNWGIMHHAGAAFAYIKATEGGGYTNPNFSSDLAAARSERLIRGAYHFARPGGGTHAQIATNATVVAIQFVRALGSLNGPGDLPPVLDLEDAGSLNPNELWLWTHTWLNVTKSLTGRTPIVYTYGSFWREKMANAPDFASYPLWLANYGVSSPPLVGGWKRYAFWQYTATGQMAGSSLGVDLSVFNGSLAELEAMTLSPAAAAASSAAASAADSAAAASSATLKYTTRAGAKPADTQRAVGTSSRSDLRSWLSVFGMDGSRTIGRP